MVTAVPTPKTSAKSRSADPLARFTAIAASQSNKPCCRANSASSIIPARKRYTSVPRPTAFRASRHGTKASTTRLAAPRTAQMASGSLHGRAITPPVATAAIAQVVPSVIVIAGIFTVSVQHAERSTIDHEWIGATASFESTSQFR